MKLDMNPELRYLPQMIYADSEGRIYDHPYFLMAGFSGSDPVLPKKEDLIPMTEYGKLFFIPGCPPIGIDPITGKYEIVYDIEIDGVVTRCYAVAAFLEPGFVRIHLPAVDYHQKSFILPLWAYTAVGFKDEKYMVSGFRIEYNYKWDPGNYDDRELVPAIEEYQRKRTGGRLIEHLINCAAINHCFAAKNLFLKRWEAPLPVSQSCNAACLGCISFQQDQTCEASQQRISFRPSREEIIDLAVEHLEQAPDAIISFGQGCEGEPLTEYKLIADSIKGIREQTQQGTINLNTNGSRPEQVRRIAESGLDSIRISLNSARPEFYRAYYRPRGYDFKDVVESITLSRDMSLYTMINYLVFPGISDQEAEIEALMDLIEQTGINFIHLKNLNIDPQYYLDKMPKTMSPRIGMRQAKTMLKEDFPDLELGYFNQPVR
ncbi:MAG: radical SAM protein [Deltaproteobacteria bacterium]|nr:radical SAM protein [Deltaproteobacteria bacterium]